MNWIEAVMAAQLRNVQRLNMMLCVLLFLVTMTWASTRSSTQELEIQNHLKKLNKPAVKSIKSPDGDMIDCVHILQQPAFDHPKLKNHKIQMIPKFHPKGRTLEENKSSKSRPIAQLWHKNGGCPEGTIPIRRTKKDDILRANSIHQFGKKQPNTIPQTTSNTNFSTHQHAVAYVNGHKYYGTEVDINVWNPQTQSPDEFSLAQLWILSGNFDHDLNTIEAGWQVFPRLYGDSNTRLFIYWTNNSYQGNGCYNHFCSGFVQVSSKIALGGSLQPISSYAGFQSSMNILVWKDPGGGNWWMQLGNDHIVGYWPGTLFPTLSDSASLIEWGGEIIDREFNGQHTTTQMGSGHFSKEGFRKAASFTNIQVVDGNNQLRDPDGLATIARHDNCYNIEKGISGRYFYYGGAGRNPSCP